MTKIIQRHDTSANWTSINPVLAAGEMGVETDTNKFKFGDGTTSWSNLAYAAGGGGTSGSGTTLTSADGATTYSKLALGDTLSVTDTSTKELNGLTQTGGTLNSELEFTGASGASLKMTEKYDLATADSWEFQIKYKYNGGGGSPTIFGYASGSDCKTPVFIYESGSLKIYMSSNGSSWDLNQSNSGLVPQTGTIYYFKVGFTGSQYYIKYNTTGWSDEFTTQWTLNSTTKVYCSDYFMFMNLSLNNNYYSSGTIYLQDTALIINGAEAWRGAKIIPGNVVLNANLDEITNKVNKLSTKIENKQDRLQAGENISITTIYPDAVDNLYLQVDNTYNSNPTATTLITNPSSYTLAQFGSVQMVNSSNASNSRSWEFVVRLPYAAYKIGVGTFCSKSAGWVGKKFGNIGITAISGSICTIEANNVSINVDYTAWSLSAPPSYVYFKLIQVAGENTIEMLYSLDGTKYVSAGSYTRTQYHYGVFINADIDGNHTIDLTQCRFQFTPAREPYAEISSILSIATTSSLGVVKPDGTSITVSETGVISGQDVKTFSGYSDTGTLVLKSINGVLQWVAEG